MPSFDHMNDGVGRYDCAECGFHTNSLEISKAHAKQCDGSGRVGKYEEVT